MGQNSFSPKISTSPSSAPSPWLRWLCLLPMVIPFGFVVIALWAQLQSWMDNVPAYAGEYILWANIALVTFLAPLLVVVYALSAFAVWRLFSGRKRILLAILVALPIIALGVFWLLALSSELGVPDALTTWVALFFTGSLPVSLVAGVFAFRMSQR